MDHYNRLCFASEGTNSPVPAPLYFGFSLCTVAVYENGSISVTAFCSNRARAERNLLLAAAQWSRPGIRHNALFGGIAGASLENN